MKLMASWVLMPLKKNGGFWHGSIGLPSSLVWWDKNKGSRRIYGGGILSSPSETVYALNAGSEQQAEPQHQPQNQPEHRAFDLLDVLRTPYRIDHIQPIYYVIDDLDTLFDIVNSDIMGMVKQAMSLGLFEPSYAVKNA